MFSSFFGEGDTFSTFLKSGEYVSKFDDNPTAAIEKGIDPHFLFTIVMLILIFGLIVSIFRGILSIRKMNAKNPRVKLTFAAFIEETGQSVLIFVVTIAVLAFLYGLFIPPAGG